MTGLSLSGGTWIDRRLPLVLALAVGCIAAPAGAEAELKTDDEQTLYIIGASVARTLTTFYLSEAELSIFIRGLEDALLERELVVDIPEAGDRVQAFHSKRVAAAAAEEKANAESFLERQAALEGATRTDSGLIITELRAGSGESPSPTDTVRVHYHGTLRDGTVFDSSVERGDEPREFPLNRVIPCWTEGLGMMKKGGKSRLVCPADIAYGDRGRPPKIPGGAALTFEVELLGISK